MCAVQQSTKKHLLFWLYTALVKNIVMEDRAIKKWRYWIRQAMKEKRNEQRKKERKKEFLQCFQVRVCNIYCAGLHNINNLNALNSHLVNMVLVQYVPWLSTDSLQDGSTAVSAHAEYAYFLVSHCCATWLQNYNWCQQMSLSWNFVLLSVPHVGLAETYHDHWVCLQCDTRYMSIHFIGETSGSHGDKYEVGCVLGCCIVLSGRYWLDYAAWHPRRQPSLCSTFFTM